MKGSNEKAKEILEARLQALRDRLDGIDAELREPEDDDFEEQAADLDDDEVLQKLSSAGRREAESIIAALKRVSDGTYGRCVTCGKEISASRLKAIPEAAECIGCAGKRG
jgi:RNA polymerase-binding transcription factor DksA